MVCPHASQNFAASSLRTPHRVQNGPLVRLMSAPLVTGDDAAPVGAAS